MAGCQRVGAEVLGRLEQIDEFDELIAGDAGDGRLAAGVARSEAVDHLLAELVLVVEHIMGNAEARRDLAGVMDVLARAAGALAMRRLAVIVELQRHADDVIALVAEQRGDDARVHAARHRHDDAGVARRLGQIEAVEDGRLCRHR